MANVPLQTECVSCGSSRPAESATHAAAGTAATTVSPQQTTSPHTDTPAAHASPTAITSTLISPVNTTTTSRISAAISPTNTMITGMDLDTISSQSDSNFNYFGTPPGAQNDATNTVATKKLSTELEILVDAGRIKNNLKEVPMSRGLPTAARHPQKNSEHRHDGSIPTWYVS